MDLAHCVACSQRSLVSALGDAAAISPGAALLSCAPCAAIRHGPAQHACLQPLLDGCLNTCVDHFGRLVRASSDGQAASIPDYPMLVWLETFTRGLESCSRLHVPFNTD